MCITNIVLFDILLLLNQAVCQWLYFGVLYFRDYKCHFTYNMSIHNRNLRNH